MHIAKDLTLGTKRNEPLPPTFESYGELEHAYDYFNGALFAGKLPRCLITLQVGRRYYGYFCGDRFAAHDGRQCDEIALNPRYFGQQPLIEVLGTLVHEMMHLWQHHFGKPGRGSYHNKQWAREMLRVGLHPSATGRPGGAMTGRSMSHYVVPGGPFESAATRLRDARFGISWFEARVSRVAAGGMEGSTGEAPLSGRRCKFTCPSCGANAWGKGSLKLMCVECRQLMRTAFRRGAERQDGARPDDAACSDRWGARSGAGMPTLTAGAVAPQAAPGDRLNL